MLKRDANKAAVANAKKSEQSSSEMENAEVRFTDMRSSAGQLTFLNQVCCHPYGIDWAGCLNHILQLVINVSPSLEMPFCVNKFGLLGQYHGKNQRSCCDQFMQIASGGLPFFNQLL